MPSTSAPPSRTWWTELLRYDLDQWHPATEADRKGLVALYERHFQEVDEFVASIRARPVIGVRVDTLPKPAIATAPDGTEAASNAQS